MPNWLDRKQTPWTETMEVPFELKSLSEEGEFEGYASIFGNVDLGGDVVVKGAFTRTLGMTEGRVPILKHHDPLRPVGITAEAMEDETGLFVKGRLDLDTQDGRETYSGLKMGYLGSLSIGYKAVDKEVRDGIRYLKEIALYEWSVLTKGWAMNPAADVVAVKSFDDMPDSFKALTFSETLMEHDENRASSWGRMYSLEYAFEDTVYDILQSGSTDMLDMVASAADEFGKACAAWGVSFIKRWGSVPLEDEMEGLKEFIMESRGKAADEEAPADEQPASISSEKADELLQDALLVSARLAE